MLSCYLFSLILATTGKLVTALPSTMPSENQTQPLYTNQAIQTDSGIYSVTNSTKIWNTTTWDTPSNTNMSALSRNQILRVIEPHEVLLYGQGRTEVVHQDVYKAMLAEDALYNVNSPTPSQRAPINGSLILSEEESNGTSGIEKRCRKYNVVNVTGEYDFLNWDVPMSSVMKGDYSNRTLISVTSGFQLANAIGISQSTDITFVKDFLSQSYSIDWTQTWTTSYAAAYTFGITALKYSVIVSNPRTHRITGTKLSGCVGSMTVDSQFVADSYFNGSYGDLVWVQGAIATCQRDTYPIQMCVGNGVIW